MGEALNLTPYLALEVAKYAKEKKLDFNAAGVGLLDRALYLSALSRAAKRSNPWAAVSALLLFVEELAWPTGINVTVRDLFSAVHAGNWEDLTLYNQEQIVSLLIEETRSIDSHWKLKCLSDQGIQSTFSW